MKTIMLVDDDTSIRQALKEKFTNQGYQILEAPDGEEAINQLQTQKCDLILLDFLMPKAHGLDVIESLQKNTLNKDSAVIFLTNYPDDPKLKKAAQDAKIEILNKTDTSLESLMATVTKAIGR